MRGAHQAENAALVLEAIRLWNETSNPTISEEICRKGLLDTHWEGRLERVWDDPIVLLDGAHNIDGIRRLTEFIKAVKKDDWVKLVFAVSADKEKATMIHEIESAVDEIVFTQFAYGRSDKATVIYELSNHPRKSVNFSIDDIVETVKRDQGKIVVFAGSLYFISEVRPKFVS